MARYVDLNNPRIIHTGRDKFGDGIYHIPPELPTVDAVEVVRCKDCIYWEQDVIFQDGWCRGKHQGNPYWFCADGERKETEDETDLR